MRFKVQGMVLEGFLVLLTVSQEKPREVDCGNGKEAENAHAGLWVLPGPDPNNRVEEGLCEEGDSWDLGAILLQS